MKVRRRAVALLLALAAACGSGSGTEEDEVPGGPADAGTTDSTTTVPKGYGGY